MDTSLLQKYAPVLNRIGLSIVFLWFGISQLLNPNRFTPYLPGFLYESAYATQIVLTNGVFEVIFGTLLLLGLFTRFSAVLLGVHLLLITIEVGYNELGVRDLGLTLSTFAIALWGKDIWSLDNKRI